MTGNGIFARTYQGESIYGTQTRSDVMSGNGRVDAGAWPGSYIPKKGVVQVVTDPAVSGMANDSNQIDGVTCAGLLVPNPSFSTGVYSMLDGERNDLLQGPPNVDGNLMKLSTLIHGANMHAEGRRSYRLVLENGVPKEYQTGFSGSTSQSVTVYSTLQSAPGTASLFGSDDGVPDNEKMVVGRRYGETPRMDDRLKMQHEKNR